MDTAFGVRYSLNNARASADRSAGFIPEGGGEEVGSNTTESTITQWNFRIQDSLGDDRNSADLFLVDMFFSLGGSKCIVRIILGL